MCGTVTACETKAAAPRLDRVKEGAAAEAGDTGTRDPANASPLGDRKGEGKGKTDDF